eukprot:4909601-Amphidinium_carterae.1
MQAAIKDECPAFFLLSYLLVAEAKLFVAPHEALELGAVAINSLQQLEPRLMSLMMESWPIEQAVNRFVENQRRIQQWQEFAPNLFSLDF